MNWREEYAKSLMTLGNLALLGLAFNGILNPNAHWWHFVIAIVFYGACVCISWLIGGDRGGREDG
jgi:hypothetical protein